MVPKKKWKVITISNVKIRNSVLNAINLTVFEYNFSIYNFLIGLKDK